MKKGDVKDLETLEEYYSKVRKIKFDDNVQIESLDDIYNNLFSLRKVGFEQKPTYFNRGKIQCASGRYRSIDDFLKVTKKYFPEKTLKEIFQYLKEREETYQKDKLIQCLRYCGNIRKYNFSGLIPMAYSSHMEISKYKLRDLNPNLRDQTVSDILT